MQSVNSNPSHGPSVSVILPTCNRRELLPRSMGSVLAQGFTDFELIVVDDASTDGTGEFIRGLGDPRIVYLPLPSNRGQAAARNAGIRAARAPFVAFQDSDDEWLPDKLAPQVEALCADASVAMVYGDLLRVPRTGEPYVLEAPALRRGKVVDGRPNLYASYGLGIQTCVIRANVLARTRGFDERMRCFEDLELFLRITRRHRSLRLPRALVRYYENDGVSTTRHRELAARAMLLRRYWLDIFLRKPARLFRERKNIRLGRGIGD